MLSDLRDLKRAFSELFAPSPEDEEASYQLAVSARRFTKRTKAVADDKLTFSATLMRAGEVDAANRLLAEFERDVRDEEAALIECVNEVKAAGAVRRQFEWRKRIGGLAAVGLIGSTVLGFSAASMAAVSMFKERASQAQHAHLVRSSGQSSRPADRHVVAKRPSKIIRNVKIAGVNVTLRGDQVAAFKALTTGTVQTSDIKRLLVLLPDAVAAKVQRAITAATNVVASPPVVSEIAVKVKKAKKEARPKHETEPSPSESPSQDSSDGSGSSSDSHNSGHHGSGKSSSGGDGQGENIPLPPIPNGHD